MELRPRFACVAMEDEEPQILTRWAVAWRKEGLKTSEVCALMFGWRAAHFFVLFTSYYALNEIKNLPSLTFYFKLNGIRLIASISLEIGCV